MLRSTYQTPVAPTPIPEGWTEHKAPTGHPYYYHAATKKSTYTRPTIEEPQSAPEPRVETLQIHNGTSNGTSLVPQNVTPREPPLQDTQDRHWRNRDSRIDRPKHKKPIPGCSPWILVTTKLRRRFIYNPEKGESHWKFPQDILIAVAELDRKEAARKERRAKGEPSDSEPEKTTNHELDDEYEEVEVTDNEDMDLDATGKPETDEAPNGPVEFNEDDFAIQLAMMDQGGDAGSEDEFDEAPPLDPDDAAALFADLLSDFGINPYTPWDQVITNVELVEDPRYTCLPNMTSRVGAFNKWSRTRMAQLKEHRQAQEKEDPRIAYLALLSSHASPKLHWPEFKRKFKKEQAMKDTRLADKDREKWYREYIKRLKLPQATLKSDFKALLGEQPLSRLNRDSNVDALPVAILTDLRYVSLGSAERLSLIKAYIELLDDAPDPQSLSDEADAAASKAKDDRKQRENALRERERQVAEEKKRRAKEQRAGRELLRQGEADLEEAMKTGIDGLRSHLQTDAPTEMEQ